MIRKSSWVWLIAEWVSKGERYPYFGLFWVGCYAVLVFLLYGSDFQISLSPMFLLLVLSVNWGGLRQGLASLAVSVATGAFLFLPDAPERFIVVALTQIMTVVIVSGLKRKAMILDSLDSNIAILTEIEDNLRYILDDFNQLSRQEIKSIIVNIHFKVIQLLTRARGWLELSRKIEQIRETMDK